LAVTALRVIWFTSSAEDDVPVLGSACWLCLALQVFLSVIVCCM